MHLRRDHERVILEGTVAPVEQFSTLLLQQAVREDSPWLRYDGKRIEIRASNRTVVYEVTDTPIAGREPSDDEFVTGRLIQEGQPDA